MALFVFCCAVFSFVLWSDLHLFSLHPAWAVLSALCIAGASGFLADEFRSSWRTARRARALLPKDATCRDVHQKAAAASKTKEEGEELKSNAGGAGLASWFLLILPTVAIAWRYHLPWYVILGVNAVITPLLCWFLISLAMGRAHKALAAVGEAESKHEWGGCTCRGCNKTRDQGHHWRHCKCERCGKVKDTGHEWNGCKCTVCGQTRGVQHDWGDEGCRRCGVALPLDEIARRWADRLKRSKDYHALAAYLCTYHDHVNDPLGHSHSVDLWNKKIRYAEAILLEAGTEAVDAMLSEMESGESKDWDVAQILVEIGDPKAVPLLKRLSDRGQWDAHVEHDKITQFVNKYPHYHGESEKEACPICGKVRPVTETERCGDKRFCEGSCWSKRGRVVQHGIGTDCPHYAEGVCMAGGRDTGLCSLQTGHYSTSCHVYSLHPG